MSGDEILVECSSLPPELRNDLQAFLERQSEVRAVTRKLDIADLQLKTNTIGLVAPRFNLIVHLVEPSHPSMGEVTDERVGRVLKKIAEWNSANSPR